MVLNYRPLSCCKNCKHTLVLDHFLCSLVHFNGNQYHRSSAKKNTQCGLHMHTRILHMHNRLINSLSDRIKLLTQDKHVKQKEWFDQELCMCRFRGGEGGGGGGKPQSYRAILVRIP